MSKFGDYSIKNNGIKKWQTIYNPFDGTPNHKYYYSSFAYSTTAGCYSQFGFFYDNTNHWLESITQLSLNKWERKSGIGIGPNNDYQVRYIVADSPAEDGVSRCCYADGAVVIDLTADFGAGNEPTILWCDRHFDYFDGTITVYK